MNAGRWLKIAVSAAAAGYATLAVVLVLWERSSRFEDPPAPAFVFVVDAAGTVMMLVFAAACGYEAWRGEFERKAIPMGVGAFLCGGVGMVWIYLLATGGRGLPQS
jgi:hypothetical protein